MNRAESKNYYYNLYYNKQPEEVPENNGALIMQNIMKTYKKELIGFDFIGGDEDLLNLEPGFDLRIVNKNSLNMKKGTFVELSKDKSIIRIMGPRGPRYEYTKNHYFFYRLQQEKEERGLRGQLKRLVASDFKINKLGHK